MNTVLDISKHQGKIDFAKMKERGISSVMCRCAYDGKEDSRFEEYYADIKKNGLRLGTYAFCTWHYSRNSLNTASAKIAAEFESNKVLRILKGKQIDGPVAIDLEFEAGCSTLLTKQEITDAANFYMDKLAAAGYRPMLYCSISRLASMLDRDRLKYPL